MAQYCFQVTMVVSGSASASSSGRKPYQRPRSYSLAGISLPKRSALCIWILRHIGSISACPYSAAGQQSNEHRGAEYKAKYAFPFHDRIPPFRGFFISYHRLVVFSRHYYPLRRFRRILLCKEEEDANQTVCVLFRTALPRRAFFFTGSGAPNSHRK